MNTFFDIFEEPAQPVQMNSELTYNLGSICSPIVEQCEADPLPSFDFNLFEKEMELNQEKQYHEEKGEYEGEIFGLFGFNETKTQSTVSAIEDFPKFKKSSRGEKKKRLTAKAKQSKLIRRDSLSTDGSEHESVDSTSVSCQSEDSIPQQQFSTFPTFLSSSSSSQAKKRTCKQEVSVLSNIQEHVSLSKDINSGILNLSHSLGQTLSLLKEEHRISKIKRKYVRKVPFKKRPKF